MSDQNAPSSNGTNDGEGQLLRSILAHWIHEDRIYWSQFRHLVVFQIAVLAAFFALGTYVLNAILMFIAAAIVWRFYFLALTIRQNRDCNLITMAEISRHLASAETESLIVENIGELEYKKWGALRIATHELKGKNFQNWVFGLCFFMNIVLGLLITIDVFSEYEILVWLHPFFGK